MHQRGTPLNLELTYLEQDFEAVALKVLSFIEGQPRSQNFLPWVTLEGPMGVGKSTLVKHLLHRFNVKKYFGSPTFPVELRYPIANHSWVQQVIHWDLYRIESLKELESRGLMDALAFRDPKDLLLIEWASQFADLPEFCSYFQNPGVEIRLSFTNGSEERRLFAQAAERPLPIST